MEKRDMKKEMKEAYNPPKGKFLIIDIPLIKYLTITGEGDPNSSERFSKGVEALYTTAYILKFSEKNKGRDFTVMPLEGLWWCDDMAKFSEDKKDEWKWKLMIAMPENIEKDAVSEAVVKGKEKKPEIIDELQEVAIEELAEGKVVQTMYIGAYKDEEPVIRAMHKFIEENGYDKRGIHHEIYLSDPRKTDEAKLKTIIRQPIIQKN